MTAWNPRWLIPIVALVLAAAVLFAALRDTKSDSEQESGVAVTSVGLVSAAIAHS